MLSCKHVFFSARSLFLARVLLASQPWHTRPVVDVEAARKVEVHGSTNGACKLIVVQGFATECQWLPSIFGLAHLGTA